MKNVTEVINILPKIIIHDILLNRLTKKAEYIFVRHPFILF